ncbi:Endoribonuclease Dicer, partial [Actinomortierella wolfii]
MMSRKMARKQAKKALVTTGLLRTSSLQTSGQNPSAQVPVQTLRLSQQQQQEAIELPRNRVLEMGQVEDFIGYTFQEKFYLHTALFSYNNPIGSFIFHRQEWLGDALVEILAADYWSQQAPEQFNNHNVRESLTNRFLGFLTIILGRHFHGSIWNGRLESARQQLSHRLDLNDIPEDRRNLCEPLPPLAERLGDIPLHELVLYLWRRALIDQEYGQEPLWQQTIIPKSAGDFFESMMGAIFLDSDLSYEATKK